MRVYWHPTKVVARISLESLKRTAKMAAVQEKQNRKEENRQQSTGPGMSGGLKA